MKLRVNLRLDTKLNAQLCQTAREHRITKTAIVEEALRRYYDPEANMALEERLLARIDRFDLQLGVLERDVAMTSEMLAHYVLYWLITFEPLAEGERDAAYALGQRRFDFFIKQVAQRVRRSPSVSEKALFPDRDYSPGHSDEDE